LTFNTSVNGDDTVPIRIQKCSDAVPAGMVTFCPSVAVSGAGTPPNQDQIAPVRGGAAPPPLPHDALSHNGVPKFVEDCGLFQIVLGMPPVSNPPSTMMSAGVHAAVGVLVGPTAAILVIDGPTPIPPTHFAATPTTTKPTKANAITRTRKNDGRI
jgi:hypothetical protein